jgi:hypothetical protein
MTKQVTKTTGKVSITPRGDRITLVVKYVDGTELRISSSYCSLRCSVKQPRGLQVPTNTQINAVSNLGSTFLEKENNEQLFNRMKEFFEGTSNFFEAVAKAPTFPGKYEFN